MPPFKQSHLLCLSQVCLCSRLYCGAEKDLPKDIFLSAAALDLCLKLPHDGRQGGHRLAVVSIKVLGDAFHEGQANPLGHILVPAGPLTFQIVVHALKKLAMGLSVICQQCTMCTLFSGSSVSKNALYLIQSN